MRFFNKDYIYLVWQNPQTRSRKVIGLLKKNGKYVFKYSKGVNEAIKEGFEPLIPFPNIKTKYTNDILFPAFSSRIPGATRVDIDEILKKYDMEEYDAFELLKRSGAKTPIDNLEFIDPIVDLKQKNLTRKFFIAGTRYYCNDDCNFVNKGNEVCFEKDLNNKYDKYAVKALVNNKLIGYIPKYYSQEIFRFLSRKRKYKCNVIEKISNCEECIKVELILNYGGN